VFVIPVFMTFRGERWKISGQWHWFWSFTPCFQNYYAFFIVLKVAVEKQ